MRPVFFKAALSSALLIAAVASPVAHARSRRAKPPAKKVQRAEPPAPAPSPSTPPAPRVQIDDNATTAELLAQAQSLYAAQEYEAVVAVSERLLQREDVTIDVRLDAYLLQGSSLAIVGDAVEAEKPFRFLLRGRPDYDMPGETPPKILAVFRKVQVEERAIVEQMRALERARVMRELALDSKVAPESKGGSPFTFAYKLKDPGRAVQSVQVHYRRAAGEPFSSLALRIDDDGIWRADLPGELTENEAGFTLEYYLVTQDARGGELLRAGDATQPLAVRMLPGTVTEARPLYKSPWLWVAVSVAVAGVGLGGWLLYERATELPNTDGLVRINE